MYANSNRQPKRFTNLLLLIMKDKIKALIIELKQENQDRSNAMNSGECSAYAHTVLVNKYNLTLEFIKRLENL